MKKVQSNNTPWYDFEQVFCPKLQKGAKLDLFVIHLDMHPVIRKVWIQGIDLINILFDAFTHKDPKSVSIRCFYTQGSQKCKNSVMLSVYFYAFGICTLKSCTQNVDEIDTRCQFHQHSTYKFLYKRPFRQLFLVTCTQKKVPKRTFVRKIRMFNVDEIDTRMLPQ